MRKVRCCGRELSQRRVADGNRPGGDALAEKYWLMLTRDRPVAS